MRDNNDLGRGFSQFLTDRLGKPQTIYIDELGIPNEAEANYAKKQLIREAELYVRFVNNRIGVQ